jgi:hypothetical protein
VKWVRKKRALPSRWTYRFAGKYYPLTLAKRFGGWESVPRAFRNFAKGKREWADVLALLSSPVAPFSVANDQRAKPRRNPQRCCPALQLPPGETQSGMFNHRATYGNPIHFPCFRHEPVNEQGVVLLFGMVAKELGYLVESVQKGFPDCEAKRQIAPGRWQRVHIEFEFESRNFRDHGHPLNGCDVIVCWRHNWPECPKQIEVVELSSIIKSLANSEGQELFEPVAIALK